MTTARAPHRRRDGFTLVELLVVVAVLGIVSTGVLFTSGDGDAAALDQLETRVDDALGRAAMLARSQRNHQGVVFDISRNRFGIVAETGDLATHPLTRADYIVELDAPDMPSGLTIEAVDFGDAGPAAIFDGQGVLLAAGSVTLARGDTRRTYVVGAATGRLSLASSP